MLRRETLCRTTRRFGQQYIALVYRRKGGLVPNTPLRFFYAPILIVGGSHSTSARRNLPKLSHREVHDE